MTIIKNTQDIEILTPNGFQKFDGIRIQKKPLLKFKFNNTDIEFVCTHDHLINFDDTLVNFKEAKDFKKGDLIAHDEFGYLIIKSISKVKTNKVYDILAVQNSDSIYFTNGIKSHNCVFVGSNKTLISGEALQILNDSIVNPIDFKYNHKMRIYEAPQPGCEYIIGVDPSEGLSQDFAAFQILKITQQKQEAGVYYVVEQVACFDDNSIKPREFAQLCVGVARWYNQAWMMAENNNACGGLCCYHLWTEFQYENMVNPDWVDKKKPGINANSKTKYLANMKLSTMVETRQVKLVDKKTITELNSYEEVGPNTYAAGNGHDDMVTSLIWALSFLDTKWYSGYGETWGSDIDPEFQLDVVAPTVINGAKQAQRVRERSNVYGGRSKQKNPWEVALNLYNK